MERSPELRTDREQAAIFKSLTWLYWLSGPLIAGAAAGRWFTPGRLLARGDIFPMTLVNPDLWMHRILYSWDPRTAIGGPAELPLYGPETLLSRFLHVFMQPSEVEQAFYTLVFSAQFLAMLFFILTILPGRRLAAYVAAVFYCFNPSMLVTIPYPMFMFLLAYLPYMAALIIRIARNPKSRTYLTIFIVSASLCSVLFYNPPTFALFCIVMLAVLAYTVIGFRRDFGRIWRPLAMAVVLGLAVNLYWIVPSYSVLFGAGHEQISAPTDAQFLSFTSQRSSILNVFWLNAYWAWNYIDYYPYKPAYQTPLVLFATFVPTFLVFSSLLNRRISRHIILTGTSGAIILALLSTGVHEPFTSINSFFFQHVPLYWLFRESTTKFPLILILLYALLIGVQVEWIENVVLRHLQGRWNLGNLLRIGIASLFGAFFLLAAFPLVTGQVEGRRNYSGFITVSNAISIPAYWSHLTRFLSQQDPNARVLLLPNDDFYQMPYSWGYYGADFEMLTELFSNPIVILSDDKFAYLTASYKYVGYTHNMEQMIRQGQRDGIASYLALQGVRFIVQRNDVVDTFPGRSILHPQQIRSFLLHQSGVHFLRSFGKLDLYYVDDRHYVPPVYAVRLTQATRIAQANDQNRDVNVGKALRLPGAGVQRSTQVPSVLHLSWTEENPARLSVSVDRSTGPILLVLSSLYHPDWHACIIPEGHASPPWSCWFSGFVPAQKHVQVLGFANGWEINQPGRYTVILDYGFQHLTDIGTALSVLTIVAVLSWGLIQGVPSLRRWLAEAAWPTLSARTS